jgi:hypothetical protein
MRDSTPVTAANFFFVSRGFLSALALCAVSLGASSQNTVAAKNCDLPAPPRAAAVNSIHGQFIFIYPREVKKEYSGCRTVWTHLNTVLAQTRFSRGELNSVELFEPGSGKVAIRCVYAKGTLRTRNADCPAYEDARQGFRTMPIDVELSVLPVPPEKDPRRD